MTVQAVAERAPTMAALSFTWTLTGSATAELTVADPLAEATIATTRFTSAPEDLLYAVTRIVLGSRMVRTQFLGEPDGYRWLFHRQQSLEG